ncbi:hypothetical protein C2G38_811154 [Gigaspora rosea]|uniref:Uncharacterized protein n=1 Tax=Gigaspora rosea TaxID=44941 RepID=A0A397U7N5_9GLOM|nr:hypothetical protein C2G38_811154 [Gigaspora rosea]
MDVLKKLGILFTEESRIDTMKKFIWDWNLLMVIKAIDKSHSINKTNMESLFQLCQLREYIVTNLCEIYRKDRFIDENIKDILRQLPIWPTYSADGSSIAAYCCCLVPHGLPYFQANLSSSKTNYINYKKPDEKILLKRLDVVESSYIHYLFSIFKNLDFVRPDDPEYLEFIKES